MKGVNCLVMDSNMSSYAGIVTVVPCLGKEAYRGLLILDCSCYLRLTGLLLSLTTNLTVYKHKIHKICACACAGRWETESDKYGLYTIMETGLPVYM